MSRLAGRVAGGSTGPRCSFLGRWDGLVLVTALADLAALIDRDLPGPGRDGRDRRALPGAELPANRVDELVAGPGGELVQPGDQVVAGPAPSQVTISRRRNPRGNAAIPASSTAR